MTFYVENETQAELPFDPEETARAVAEQVLQTEGCPYEAQISLLLTDDEGIRRYNRDFRGMDRPTDVLSFPNVEYGAPSDFQAAEGPEADCFDPESGELVLGDIVISVEKAVSQAEEYGHSVKREFAFLTAHSMLHLCGYDHMEAAEAAVMEEKQRLVLKELNITRD